MRYFKKIFPAIVVISLVVVGFTQALGSGQNGTSGRKSVSPAEAMEILPIYQLLSGAEGAEDAMRAKTHEDWKSYSSNETYRGLEETIQTSRGARKAIPDLKWEIKHVNYDEAENAYIVRGEATGTPQGDNFFGTPIPGGKSFKMMSIDIHYLNDDGQVIKTYHIEDWSGATRQLLAE